MGKPADGDPGGDAVQVWEERGLPAARTYGHTRSGAVAASVLSVGHARNVAGGGF